VGVFYVVTHPSEYLYQCVRELAGKETKVSLVWTVGLSLYGVASTITAAVGFWKQAGQKEELITLRERSSRLESQLAQKPTKRK
jgi:hypothetical protein